MKLFTMTLCMMLILCLTGCALGSELDTPVTFYYCMNDFDYQNDPQVLGKEQRDGSAYQDSLDDLLNDYLKGPESDSLYNPFPTGSAVISSRREGNVLTIHLSEQFDRLPLEELSLAMACLVQTTFDYVSAPVVLVIPYGTFIDGSTYRTYTSDSFLYSDENTAYSPPQ